MSEQKLREALNEYLQLIEAARYAGKSKQWINELKLKGQINFVVIRGEAWYAKKDLDKLKNE